MRIGILQSGYEILPLFQCFQHYDHEYHIFCDYAYWPWGDKSPALRQERVQMGIDYLSDKVDILIVPPVLELQGLSSSVPILPLFSTYLLEFAFKYSLVGKIGLLGDAVDKEYGQEFVAAAGNKYILSESQQATTSFQQPMAFWQQEVRMWKYFLTTYGRRDWMVRKTLKYDLRYFHDAAVDTLVPLDRGMLFWQKIIRQRINWKKMRFHGLDAVQICFEKITTEYIMSPNYSVTMHCTDTPQTLFQERKWMDLLGRGDEKLTRITLIQ